MQETVLFNILCKSFGSWKIYVSSNVSIKYIFMFSPKACSGKLENVLLYK
jgi:hypothetical protein